MYILFINSSRIYFLFLFFIFHSNAQFNNNNNNSSSSSSSSSSNYKKKKMLSNPWVPRFWNPNRTVWSDLENLKPLIFAVLLGSRTVLWEKSRDPCESRSDLTVLRIMTEPLLTVPYFPLYLNLKIKK